LVCNLVFHFPTTKLKIDYHYICCNLVVSSVKKKLFNPTIIVFSFCGFDINSFGTSIGFYWLSSGAACLFLNPFKTDDSFHF